MCQQFKNFASVIYLLLVLCVFECAGIVGSRCTWVSAFVLWKCLSYMVCQCLINYVSEFVHVCIV